MILAVIVSLCLLIIALGVALFFSVRLNLRNADKFEQISDQIEESLDVLDTCYQRAASRAELEVMSDEPVVRELVEDIRTTRDAILLVANLIITPFDEESDE